MLTKYISDIDIFKENTPFIYQKRLEALTFGNKHLCGYCLSNELIEGSFSLLDNVFTNMSPGGILSVGVAQGFRAAALSQGKATSLTIIDVNPLVIRSAIIFKAFLKIILFKPDAINRANLWAEMSPAEQAFLQSTTPKNGPYYIYPVEMTILEDQIKLPLNIDYLANPFTRKVLSDLISKDAISFRAGSLTDQEIGSKLPQNNNYSLFYYSNIPEWLMDDPGKIRDLKSGLNSIKSTTESTLIFSRSKGIKPYPIVMSYILNRPDALWQYEIAAN